jgi:hypothetical protein
MLYMTVHLAIFRVKILPSLIVNFVCLEYPFYLCDPVCVWFCSVAFCVPRIFYLCDRVCVWFSGQFLRVPRFFLRLCEWFCVHECIGEICWLQLILVISQTFTRLSKCWINSMKIRRASIVVGKCWRWENCVIRLFVKNIWGVINMMMRLNVCRWIYTSVFTPHSNGRFVWKYVRIKTGEEQIATDWWSVDRPACG